MRRRRTWKDVATRSISSALGGIISITTLFSGLLLLKVNSRSSVASRVPPSPSVDVSKKTKKRGARLSSALHVHQCAYASSKDCHTLTSLVYARFMYFQYSQHSKNNDLLLIYDSEKIVFFVLGRHWKGKWCGIQGCKGAERLEYYILRRSNF